MLKGVHEAFKLWRSRTGAKHGSSSREERGAAIAHDSSYGAPQLVAHPVAWAGCSGEKSVAVWGTPLSPSCCSPCRLSPSTTCLRSPAPSLSLWQPLPVFSLHAHCGSLASCFTPQCSPSPPPSPSPSLPTSSPNAAPHHLPSPPPSPPSSSCGAPPPSSSAQAASEAPAPS